MIKTNQGIRITFSTFRQSNQIQVLLFLLLLSTTTFAQQTKIVSIELSDVQSAYVDRPGDVYILQKNNVLKKFDSLGNLLFENKFNIPPAVFDPRDGARMFKYQKETGQCSFYSEETKQDFLIEQQYAIEPALICASGDHHIWIFDQADFSLKKIDPAQSKVLVESAIDQRQFKGKPQFTFMREYQNFLFMYEKNTGILIFNSLGIQIKKISITKIEYFNFLGEELYYKKNDKLIFHDLFDASIREESVNPECTFALKTDSRTYLVYPTRLDIFKNR